MIGGKYIWQGIFSAISTLSGGMERENAENYAARYATVHTSLGTLARPKSYKQGSVHLTCRIPTAYSLPVLLHPVSCNNRDTILFTCTLRTGSLQLCTTINTIFANLATCRKTTTRAHPNVAYNSYASPIIGGGECYLKASTFPDAPTFRLRIRTKDSSHTTQSFLDGVRTYDRHAECAPAAIGT